MVGVGSVSVETKKPNVQVYEKHVYDDPNQDQLSANHMGYLRKNSTRLTAMGKLAAKKGTEKDTEDYFKISMQTAGKLKMTLDGDAKIRVQILTLNKRVIADTRPGQGRASEVGAALEAGTYSMKKGDYIVKVTREQDTPATKLVNYAVQFRVGEKHKQDYVTWEHPTPEQKTQPVLDPIVNSMQSAMMSLFDFTA